jgi:hypothetical protein
MKMAKILLIENARYVADYFVQELGQTHYLDVVSSAREIPGHPTRRWDIAFVDFELAGGPSGLTALTYLRDRVEHPVAFTAAGESGRDLFNLAAHAWFDVKIVYDKADDRPLSTVVSAILSGRNPTRPGILRNLSDQAKDLDGLFRTSRDVEIWQALDKTGSVRAAATVLGVEARVLSEFKNKVAGPAERLAIQLNQVLSNRAPGTYAPLLDIVMHFAGLNRVFFNIPDLEEVVRRRDRERAHH